MHLRMAGHSCDIVMPCIGLKACTSLGKRSAALLAWLLGYAKCLMIALIHVLKEKACA